MTNDGVGRGQEDDRADDVLRNLVALDRARGDRDVAELLDDLGLRLDAGAHRESGRDAVDADPVLAELLRERAREGHDRALARHVVEEERHAAERRPGGDVHDRAAAPLPHPRARRARQTRNMLATFTSMTRRHSSSGISVERPHGERGVQACVVDDDVDAAAALDDLGGHPLDVLLRGDVAVSPTPSGTRRSLLGALQVGDDDPRALGGEPVGDRVPDALRAAGDERDLAVELHLIGENETGTRIRFCCVWMSGWILARNAFQRSSAWSRARRSSRSPALS